MFNDLGNEPRLIQAFEILDGRREAEPGKDRIHYVRIIQEAINDFLIKQGKPPAFRWTN